MPRTDFGEITGIKPRVARVLRAATAVADTTDRADEAKARLILVATITDKAITDVMARQQNQTDPATYEQLGARLIDLIAARNEIGGAILRLTWTDPTVQTAIDTIKDTTKHLATEALRIRAATKVVEQVVEVLRLVEEIVGEVTTL